MKFFMLFCLLAGFVAASDKPGANVIISQNGLEYLKETLLPFGETMLKQMTFADITGVQNVAVVGNVSYIISDLKVEGIEIPYSHFSIDSPANLRTVATGVAVNASFSWTYAQQNWPNVKDSGTGVIRVTQLMAGFTVQLFVDDNGFPGTNSGDCTLDFGSIDIDLSGGASWLYDFLLDILVPRVQDNIAAQVCTELPAMIDNMVESTLSVYEPQIAISNGISLSFKFMPGFLSATSTYGISAGVEAEFFPDFQGTGGYDGTPADLPTGENKEMIGIYVSNFTLDSLLYALEAGGVLAGAFTKANAPAEIAEYLTTDFFAQYAPNITSVFGSVDAGIVYNVIEKPVMELSTKGFKLFAPILLTIVAPDADGNNQEAFSILCDAEADGIITVVNNSLISGSLEILNASVTLTNTNVGEIDMTNLNEFIVFALYAAQCLANDYLAAGIALPSISGLSFVNPVVRFDQDYIFISSDINYAPDGLFRDVAKYHPRNYVRLH